MRYFLIAPAAMLLLLASQTEPSSAPASAPQPINLSMNAAEWLFLYSPTMVTHPSPHPDGWSFERDRQRGGHGRIIATG
jgi:hypothetical protein